MQTPIRSAKEAVRHALHVMGLRPRTGHLELGTRQERFSRVYDQGLWKQGRDDQPLSGPGSSLDATASIREQLPQILAQLGSKTILDVGCGDLTWMCALALSAEYIGVDVVPSVIEADRLAMPSGRFYCLDAVTDELPEADTVICREVLFHLSFADASQLLANLRKKPRRWLIATTDTATLINSDIVSGDFRLINLSQSPFRFPKAKIRLADSAVSAGRYLAVWDFGELPQAD